MKLPNFPLEHPVPARHSCPPSKPDMAIIPNLRSPRDKVGGMVYFGRMLDKIRLHAKGELTPDYVENLGEGFDGRMVTFLNVSYEGVKTTTLKGAEDHEVLAWCLQNGRMPTEQDIEIWNDFMTKRGWNDGATSRVTERKQEAGMADREDIVTMFDFIDADEGR